MRRLAVAAIFACNCAFAALLGGSIMFAMIPPAFRNHAPAIVLSAI